MGGSQGIGINKQRDGDAFRMNNYTDTGRNQASPGSNGKLFVRPRMGNPQKVVQNSLSFSYFVYK